MQEKIDEKDYFQEKVIGNQALLMINKNEMLLSTSHRSIGALTFRGRFGKTGKGSAVLISNNLILTAAHNVYDKQYSVQHSDFKFYLAPCGIVQKYHSIKNWRFPSQYIECPVSQNGKFDYALMKLEENIENPIKYSNFLELSITCAQCQLQDYSEMKLDIYGYPYHQTMCRNNYKTFDKQQKKIQLYQYGLTKSGQVLSIQPIDHKISYSITTLPGQSGCPVLSFGNIIAIHIGFGKFNVELNIGRLITYELVDDLQIWSKQLKGSQFTINPHTLCPHYNKKMKKTSDKSIEKYPIYPSNFLHKNCQDISNSLSTIESKHHNESSKELFKENNQDDRTKATSILFDLGKNYYNQYNYSMALQNLLHCLKIQQQIKGKGAVELAEILDWIGSTYYQQNEFNKAIQYYEESIKICRNYQARNNRITLYSLGCAYKQIQNYKQAAKHFELSLRAGENIRNKSWVKISANQLTICLKLLNEQERPNKLMKLKTI